MNCKSLALTSAVLFLSLSLAKAQVFSTGQVAGDSNIETVGSVVYAFALNSSASGTTINGVAFTGINPTYSAYTTSPDFTLTNEENGYDNTGGGTESNGTDGNYSTALQALVAQGTGNNWTLVLKGLTAGQTYSFQAIFDANTKDARTQALEDTTSGSSPYPTSGTITAGGDQGYPVQNPDPDPTGAQYITDTFTATGSTETLVAQVGGGSGAQLSGFVLENAPPHAVVDIGPMIWNAAGRSDWINVKSCTQYPGCSNAVGDGVTDDTAAINSVLNYISNDYNHHSAAFFPAGTYKISGTLNLHNTFGEQLVGCGSSSIIEWAGASGGAMFFSDSNDLIRFIGLVWDGKNLAGCAYEHNSVSGGYETQMRHENESFRNFTVGWTYSYTDQNGPETQAVPPAAIVSGFPGSQVTADSMIYNCSFYNCGGTAASGGSAIIDALNTYQNYEWIIDGCEFENGNNGISFYVGGCYTVSNCHFQNNTGIDINGGYNIHVNHCTSVDDYQFYRDFPNNSVGPDVFQDCWIDGWKNPEGAIDLRMNGGNEVFDCTFTDAPAGANAPVNVDQSDAEILLSNNYAPSFNLGSGAGLLWNQTPAITDIVSSGSRTGTLTSPTQTFLNTTYPADSPNIIDISKAPYNILPVQGNIWTDCTSELQAAINAATTANNGSIVYIPPGLYKISSTLTASGSNYTIEGSGTNSQICWYGGSNSTMLTIASPQNVEVHMIHFAALNNLYTGLSFLGVPEPECDPATVTGIKETSTGASNIIYDTYLYDAYTAQTPPTQQNPQGTQGNPYSTYPNMNGPGLVLSSLPAGATVNIPFSSTPLTVQNCGAAQIFSKFLENGAIDISGTTADTGFLGFLFNEGMQQTVGDYNIVVDDNQSLVLGNYYSEQGRAGLELLRGSGTGTGDVTIQGFSTSSGLNDNPGGLNGPTTSININNYEGNLFFGSSFIADDGGQAPVQITQTGSNPVNLILAGDEFVDGAPTLSLGSGANLTQTLETWLESNDLYTLPADRLPEVGSNLDVMIPSLDHLRQLEAVDLSVECGIQEAVANTSAEFDPVNPNPLTAIGYNPADWTVSNSAVLGSGARNFTVVNGASPFAAGNQSMLYEDTTGSISGSTVSATQNFTATPYNEAAVETFDFRCNASGTLTNVWIWSKCASAEAAGVHVTSNGTTGTLSAEVGASDTFLCNFSVGIWYRAQIVMGAPSAGQSNATLYLTPWYGNGAGPTASYTINGVPAGISAGFNAMQISTGAVQGASQNMNIDNVSLTANSQPFIPAATGTDSGLVAHWTLDESTETTSYDTSGSQIDGTWQNSPTFSATHPSAITFPDAGSLSFNGTNQYVTMGNPAALPSGKGARTICAWAKSSTTAAGTRVIASFGTGSTGEAMFIGMSGTAIVGGGYASSITAPAFWDTNWHFIAMTYDGTTAKLYGDGVLKTSAAISWNLVHHTCSIGDYLTTGGDYWNGQVDDVRIYNRALTATEISNLAAGNP